MLVIVPHKLRIYIYLYTPTYQVQLACISKASNSVLWLTPRIAAELLQDVKKVGADNKVSVIKI